MFADPRAVPDNRTNPLDRLDEIKKKKMMASQGTGPRFTPQGQARSAARVEARKAARMDNQGGSEPFYPPGNGGPYNQRPKMSQPTPASISAFNQMTRAQPMTQQAPRTMPPVPQGDPAEYAPSVGGGRPMQKPPMTRDWLPLPGDPAMQGPPSYASEMDRAMIQDMMMRNPDGLFMQPQQVMRPPAPRMAMPPRQMISGI